MASLFTQDPLFLALAGLFSVFPDFDWPLQHRGWFSHSLFSAAILAAAGFFASGDLRFPGVVFLAISSHLLLDLFTKSGVPLLYPWRDETCGLRLFNAQSRAMNAAFQLVGLMMLSTGLCGFSLLAG